MADLVWNFADGRVLAHFSIEDLQVELQFEERGPGEWTASFELLTTPKSLAYLSFQMFNGVFQAAEEFIALRQPGALVFATKRGQLAHIYETYLRREEERIRQLGYNLSEVQAVAPFKEYVLKRNRASRWREI